MTCSLSAEPSSQSLLLAMNLESKPPPGAEPSEVAVTPSLATTGTLTAIYVPIYSNSKFQEGWHSLFPQLMRDLLL